MFQGTRVSAGLNLFSACELRDNLLIREFEQSSTRRSENLGGLALSAKQGDCNDTDHAFLYGLVAYLIFFVTFLYAIGFVTGVVVPKTIDRGTIVLVGEALAVNILLMSLFAIQHSVMARKPFKQWGTQFVPVTVERSTYVLFASLALALLFWQWRPVPTLVWQIANSESASAVLGLSFAGWLLVLRGPGCKG